MVLISGLLHADANQGRVGLGRSGAGSRARAAFKDDTLQADDRTLFLKVRDVVEAAASEATLRLVGDRLRKTMGIRLAGDPVKTVEILANRYGLNDDERSGVLRDLIDGGQLSGYGLAAGRGLRPGDRSRGARWQAD